MLVKKIRKNVLFKTRVERDNFSKYLLGTVVYDNESIDFGKAIISSDISHVKKGTFLFDDNYIYECIVGGTLSKVFDIDKREEISSVLELIKVRELYKENNPKKKLK